MDNAAEDKTVSKEMARPPEKNIHKPPIEAGFPIPPSGMVVYGKTKTKMLRPRTPSDLKEQFLRHKT